MKSTRRNVFLGLFFLITFATLNLGLKGQILKNVTDPIKKAGNTVTQPIKDTRESVKEISQPVKDVRNAKREVTQPVTDVKREVDGLQSDVKRVESDVDRLKGDVSNTRSNVRNRTRSNKDDGTSAASGADDSARDKARADSVYKSRMRTGTKVKNDQATPPPTRTVEADKSISGSRTVLLPPSTIKARPRQPDYTYNQIGESRPATMRPGYQSSPAKSAIDRAEFDIETIEELFSAAIWTGPDSVHTARSIDYMLGELRTDINDIKRRDPDWDTILYEDKYRKWRALYRRNTEPESIFE